MEIGFLTAFLGGVLALLSPCGALLLPAFFASSLGTKVQLLIHGGVFYLGLAVTLVPFGLGLGALGSLFLEQRALVIAITSVVLVLLGLAQALGLGFDLSRIVPGARAVQQRAGSRTGLLRTFLLGTVSGVAGFCAGPILGAVLTVAMGQGSTWTAGALLAVYGAGMVVPLMLIAGAWGKLGAGGRRLLAGRRFTFLGREFHSTSLITGILIVIVGLLFWFTNGFLDAPSLVSTDVQVWAQSRGAVLSRPIYDVIAVIVLAGLALAAWMFARRRAAGGASETQLEQPATAVGDQHADQ